MAYRIDPNKCMCCHNCALECPVEAINYVGSMYAVDPDQCISCGKCAELCNVAAVADENPAPAPAKADMREMACDLVVLGGGAAGLISAVRAAQQSGAKVVVLEKAAKPGGSAWYAHGFMTIGSRWEQEAGVPDGREQIYRRSMRETDWKLDPKLIHKYIYSVGSFFDWLVEQDEAAAKGCFGIMEMFPGHKAVSFPVRKYDNLLCRDPAIGPGWGGSYVIRKMLEKCQQLGVQVLTGHQAVDIFRGEDGGVTGVMAETDTGLVKIACRACVLATGGWARNDELLKKYWPSFFSKDGGEPVHRFAVPTVTGDVVGLANKAGAALDLDNLCVNIFGPVHHPFSYCVFRFQLQPQVAHFNLNGKRFIDESDFTLGSFVIADQPKQIAWSVVDSDTLELIANNLIANPPDKTDGWIFEGWKEEVERELALDTPLKKADTLEELADLMGVDKETFLVEVERYNRFCDQGEDEDFFKRADALRPIRTGPFYGIFGKRATDGAFGGVVIDPDTRVLDTEGRPIPGLYAAGDNTAGWHVKTGERKATVLSDLTWAVTSGWLAGGAVGDYLN